MKGAITVAATCLLMACTPRADDADTMSLSAVDTLKPAGGSTTVSAGATSGATTAATATPAVPGATKSTTAAQTKTGTKTAPIDTTNIGRDRAIPINTKDPKVRLPTVDTTKRPPGGA